MVPPGSLSHFISLNNISSAVTTRVTGTITMHRGAPQSTIRILLDAGNVSQPQSTAAVVIATSCAACPRNSSVSAFLLFPARGTLLEDQVACSKARFPPRGNKETDPPARRSSQSIPEFPGVSRPIRHDRYMLRRVSSYAPFVAESTMARLAIKCFEGDSSGEKEEEPSTIGGEGARFN